MFPTLSALSNFIAETIPSQSGGSSFIDNLDSHDTSLWHKAHGWANGNPFNNGWRADKVIFRNGTMTLRLDNDGCPYRCSNKNYVSGEYRSNRDYKYGYLEARIKAASAPGTTTTLFFYTGKKYGHYTHHEIDFEIYGKDPTQLQINYYVRGIGKAGEHKKDINLGFDASKGFHTYGILWKRDSIEWYVDRKLVHRAKRTPNMIPNKPCKIMLNLWPGNNSPDMLGWLGRFKYTNPLRADYDWVRFVPLNKLPKTGIPPAPKVTSATTATPTPGPSPIPTITPSPTPAVPGRQTPIPRRTLPLPPFGVPDPELGKTDVYNRPQLNRAKVEKHISLARLAKVLSEIGRVPIDRVLDPDLHLLSTQEFKKRYPELAKIKLLDKNYDYKLYWYLRDPRTYFDNVILLFSVYVQKITENTDDDLLKTFGADKQDLLHQALGMVNKFKKRLFTQTTADKTSAKKRSPSAYTLASLSLIQAEIYSQIENKGDKFYKHGIMLTTLAIQEFFTLTLNRQYPSKPDYYSILKGVIVLGDLYSRLATLTNNVDYYKRAADLYQSIIGLDADYDRGLSIHLPDIGLSLDITPQQISNALDDNISERYITAQDKDLALGGIYHQLRGMALIKSASLFTARPGPKSMDEIYDYFADSIYGMINLKIAAKEADLPDIKNRYFYLQAKVIQGQLIMLLADRVNYYHRDRTMVASPPAVLDALAAARKHFPHEQRFGILEDQFSVLSSDSLIAIARDDYFSGVPNIFKYLHATAIVKLLEIAIRNAEFVHDTRGGKVPDATDLLAFSKNWVAPAVAKVSQGRIKPEFLRIAYTYLEIILQLAGRTKKNKKTGRYKLLCIRGTCIDNSVLDPLKVIELAGQIEKIIPSLPKAARVYFEVSVALKEAGAMLQILQHWKYKKLKNSPPIRQWIKQKTGKKMKLKNYVLQLLRKIEKRTAPFLPAYLWYNTSVTLPHFISKNKFNHKRVADNIKVLRQFFTLRIQGLLKETYEEKPTHALRRVNLSTKKRRTRTLAMLKALHNNASYHHVRHLLVRTINIIHTLEKLETLDRQRLRRKKTETLAALKTFIGALKALNKNSDRFVATYSEVNAWDKRTIYAELYHLLANSYGLNRKNSIKYQYGQSAFIESAKSSSPYDRKYRPWFIIQSIRKEPDKRVPLLRKLYCEMYPKRCR
jgi:beta-glucanase (GH16 family)